MHSYSKESKPKNSQDNAGPSSSVGQGSPANDHNAQTPPPPFRTLSVYIKRSCGCNGRCKEVNLKGQDQSDPHCAVAGGSESPNNESQYSDYRYLPLFFQPECASDKDKEMPNNVVTISEASLREGVVVDADKIPMKQMTSTEVRESLENNPSLNSWIKGFQNEGATSEMADSKACEASDEKPHSTFENHENADRSVEKPGMKSLENSEDQVTSSEQLAQVMGNEDDKLPEKETQETDNNSEDSMPLDFRDDQESQIDLSQDIEAEPRSDVSNLVENAGNQDASDDLSGQLGKDFRKSECIDSASDGQASKVELTEKKTNEEVHRATQGALSKVTHMVVDTDEREGSSISTAVSRTEDGFATTDNMGSEVVPNNLHQELKVGEMKEVSEVNASAQDKHRSSVVESTQGIAIPTKSKQVEGQSVASRIELLENVSAVHDENESHPSSECEILENSSVSTAVQRIEAALASDVNDVDVTSKVPSNDLGRVRKVEAAKEAISDDHTTPRPAQCDATTGSVEDTSVPLDNEHVEKQFLDSGSDPSASPTAVETKKRELDASRSEVPAGDLDSLGTAIHRFEEKIAITVSEEIPRSDVAPEDCKLDGDDVSQTINKKVMSCDEVESSVEMKTGQPLENMTPNETFDKNSKISSIEQDHNKEDVRNSETTDEKSSDPSALQLLEDVRRDLKFQLTRVVSPEGELAQNGDKLSMLLGKIRASLASIWGELEMSMASRNCMEVMSTRIMDGTYGKHIMQKEDMEMDTIFRTMTVENFKKKTEELLSLELCSYCALRKISREVTLKLKSGDGLTIELAHLVQKVSKQLKKSEKSDYARFFEGRVRRNVLSQFLDIQIEMECSTKNEGHRPLLRYKVDLYCNVMLYIGALFRRRFIENDVMHNTILKPAVELLGRCHNDDIKMSMLDVLTRSRMQLDCGQTLRGRMESYVESIRPFMKMSNQDGGELDPEKKQDLTNAEDDIKKKRGEEMLKQFSLLESFVKER